jgi:endonuclease III
MPEAKGHLMAKKKEVMEALMERLGGRFSTSLGIDLDRGESGEIFKWFLASILFGARISEKIAEETYGQFERIGLLTPQRILGAGWDRLVEALDAGGYVRYDFKTATMFLEVMEGLQERYGGDLSLLHNQAVDPRDLEARLEEFKGIGPVTVNIFLRELRAIWPKAQPLPGDLAILAARNLRLTSSSGQTPEEKAQVLSDLQQLLSEEAEGFADFEAALVRLGKDWCRKERHRNCPLGQRCRYRRRLSLGSGGGI